MEFTTLEIKCVCSCLLDLQIANGKNSPQEARLINDILSEHYLTIDDLQDFIFSSEHERRESILKSLPFFKKIVFAKLLIMMVAIDGHITPTEYQKLKEFEKLYDMKDEIKIALQQMG